MQPRNVPGRIAEVDDKLSQLVIALDSGTAVRFPRGWNDHDRGLELGTRVLVTFGTKDQIVRVGLDLSDLGLTELEASTLGNLEARFTELTAIAPLTPQQRAQFGAALEMHQFAMGKDARKLRDRLSRALDGDVLPITDDDAWAAAAREELPAIAHREAWLNLLGMTGDGSKPTKKWLTAASAHVAKIGAPAFVDAVRRWFGLVAVRKVVRDENNWFAPAMADTNTEALRNLVWACSVLADAEPVVVAIGDLAVRCFTKVKGVGALSMKAGNACIYVLAQLPGMRSVAQLSRLAARVRYKQALALVDKAMAEAAKRAGVTPLDLEELALPTFGLDVTGRARTAIGAHVAQLAIVDDSATLEWFDGAKRVKSIPAAVKAEHADELAELKIAHKELAALVPTVRARFERWMLEPRAWTLADLRTRYLDHPLVAQLARRVIYVTGDTSVMFVDGYALDRAGTRVDLADDAMLSLWHPLERPAAEVAAWRDFIANLELAQPFKQVERETYVVSAEERDAFATSTFAGRTVRQHKLAALCRERGWSYRLQGAFDGADAPRRHVAAYDLDVELAADPADNAQVADSGIYLEVTTGDVRFERDHRPLALRDVPPRCFSELMRDVDLFVS